MAKTNWEGSELRLERDGNDLLLHMGGKLIAKRGRPGPRTLGYRSSSPE